MRAGLLVSCAACVPVVDLDLPRPDDFEVKSWIVLEHEMGETLRAWGLTEETTVEIPITGASLSAIAYRLPLDAFELEPGRIPMQLEGLPLVLSTTVSGLFIGEVDPSRIAWKRTSMAAGFPADFRIAPIDPIACLDRRGCRPDPREPSFRYCEERCGSDDIPSPQVPAPPEGVPPIRDPSPCPEGQVRFIGDIDCRDVLPPCESGWPAMLPSDTVYVDTSGPPGGDGSRMSPRDTMPGSGTVAFRGSLALLVIAEPITILGCGGTGHIETTSISTSAVTLGGLQLSTVLLAEGEAELDSVVVDHLRTRGVATLETSRVDVIEGAGLIVAERAVLSAVSFTGDLDLTDVAVDGELTLSPPMQRSLMARDSTFARIDAAFYRIRFDRVRSGPIDLLTSGITARHFVIDTGEPYAIRLDGADADLAFAELLAAASGIIGRRSRSVVLDDTSIRSASVGIDLDGLLLDVDRTTISGARTGISSNGQLMVDNVVIGSAAIGVRAQRIAGAVIEIGASEVGLDLFGVDRSSGIDRVTITTQGIGVRQNDDASIVMNRFLIAGPLGAPAAAGLRIGEVSEIGRLERGRIVASTALELEGFIPVEWYEDLPLTKLEADTLVSRR